MPTDKGKLWTIFKSTVSANSKKMERLAKEKSLDKNERIGLETTINNLKEDIMTTKAYPNQDAMKDTLRLKEEALVALQKELDAYNLGMGKEPLVLPSVPLRFLTGY